MQIKGINFLFELYYSEKTGLQENTNQKIQTESREMEDEMNGIPINSVSYHSMSLDSICMEIQTFFSNMTLEIVQLIDQIWIQTLTKLYLTMSQVDKRSKLNLLSAFRLYMRILPILYRCRLWIHIQA